MTELSKRLCWVSVYAVAMALYVFISDSLHALLQGRSDWDTLRPQPFQWTLFLVALVLIAVPGLMATGSGIWSTTQSKISKTLINR
jgi:hypothetical protein